MILRGAFEGLGFRVWISGFRVAGQELGSRGYDSGIRRQGLRHSGSGISVQGSRSKGYGF